MLHFVDTWILIAQNQSAAKLQKIFEATIQYLMF